MPLPNVLSPKEVAGLLAMDETTVRRWCHDGKIPAMQVSKGGHWRVKLRALSERNPSLFAELSDAWVAKQTGGSRATDMQGW